MKFFVTLLTIILPAMTWAQAVGGGGNTGGGLRMRTLQYGCTEGRTGWISLYRKGEVYREQRVCQNGSYMTPAERAAYIYNPRTSCEEGAFLQMDEYDHGRAKDIRVVKQCQSGKWITVRSE